MGNPIELRREIEELSRRLEASHQKLAAIERSCKHDWNDPVYTPERHEAYRFEGDPPGTMGVDRQLPVDVPAQTIDMWTRLCKKCGRKETTKRTDVVQMRGAPKF